MTTQQNDTAALTHEQLEKEYGGLRVNHLKRLKALELENGRLRTAVTDQALALVIFKETAGKTDEFSRPEALNSLIMSGPTTGGRSITPDLLFRVLKLLDNLQPKHPRHCRNCPI